MIDTAAKCTKPDLAAIRFRLTRPAENPQVWIYKTNTSCKDQSSFVVLFPPTNTTISYANLTYNDTYDYQFNDNGKLYKGTIKLISGQNDLCRYKQQIEESSRQWQSLQSQRYSLHSFAIFPLLIRSLLSLKAA